MARGVRLELDHTLAPYGQRLGKRGDRLVQFQLRALGVLELFVALRKRRGDRTQFPRYGAKPLFTPGKLASKLVSLPFSDTQCLLESCDPILALVRVTIEAGELALEYA